MFIDLSANYYTHIIFQLIYKKNQALIVRALPDKCFYFLNFFFSFSVEGLNDMIVRLAKAQFDKLMN